MKNPYEPSADSRSGAAFNYDFYRAHVDAGFTEEEAMTILQTMMHSIVTAAINNSEGDD